MCNNCIWLECRMQQSHPTSQQILESSSRFQKVGYSPVILSHDLEQIARKAFSSELCSTRSQGLPKKKIHPNLPWGTYFFLAFCIRGSISLKIRGGGNYIYTFLRLTGPVIENVKKRCSPRRIWVDFFFWKSLGPCRT